MQTIFSDTRFTINERGAHAAKRLRKDLKDAGLNPWLDKEELLPGQNWQDQIEDAISKSRYFIPLFSKTSVEKIGYVQSEFKFALDVLKRYLAVNSNHIW